MKRFYKDLLTVPNVMSIFRLLSAPFVAICWLSLDWWVTGLILGTVSGVTDLFDGIVARKLNQVTELGELIDQLGDLVFESICFLLAIMLGELWSGWLVIYFCREFTVTVIRTYVHSRGGKLPSTVMGKAKSSFFQYAFFIFFLGLILLRPDATPDSYTIVGIPPGRMLIWVGMASFVTGFLISLISGWRYLRAFARFYTKHVEAGR